MLLLLFVFGVNVKRKTIVMGPVKGKKNLSTKVFLMIVDKQRVKQSDDRGS